MFDGMKNGAHTTIDRAGRVVVPKSIREAAGFEPGTKLAVRLVGGRVELEPEPVAVRIERRDGLAVAVAEEPMPELTTAEVRRTREATRRGGESG